MIVSMQTCTSTLCMGRHSDGSGLCGQRTCTLCTLSLYFVLNVLHFTAGQVAENLLQNINKAHQSENVLQLIFMSSSAAAAKEMQDPLGMGTFDPVNLGLVRAGSRSRKGIMQRIGWGEVGLARGYVVDMLLLARRFYTTDTSSIWLNDLQRRRTTRESADDLQTAVVRGWVDEQPTVVEGQALMTC